MRKPTMEELFETLPPVPENIEELCREHRHTAPIYYRRRGKYADCRCGKCNALYIVEDTPYRDEPTKCRVCGAEGRYEWMRCTRSLWQQYTVLVLQKRTDNNLVLRYFQCTGIYRQGEPEHFSFNETRRVMLDIGDFYTFYCHRYYGQENWGSQANGSGFEDYWIAGWKNEIEDSNFKYMPMRSQSSMVGTLKAYSRNPGIEMYEKMGMETLVRDLVMHEGRSKLINRRAKGLKKQLRLKDKKRINYLQSNDEGLRMLEILQMEEKQGTVFSDEVREYLVEQLFVWDGRRRIDHMLRYMSIDQLVNRVNKYKSQRKDTWVTRRSITAEYDDYLLMREELGYDMTNSVFLYPKNLKAKHDEMVAEKNARRDELHAKKKREMFAGIEGRFEELQKRYNAEGEGYLIRPARDAEEIINEGRTLHHCVGTDRYLQRHCNGETSILFLRRTEEPDVPYYTIEIKDKEILQWYGQHDTKPDKENIGEWLNRYIVHIGGNQVVYG